MVDDDVVGLGPGGRDAVRFPAAAPGLPGVSGTDVMCCTRTSWVVMRTLPRMRVMPGDGAVCPAMVTKGSSMTSVLCSKSITPPTSKTTRRGPCASSAARSEPGPSASRFVTRRMCPSSPPFVVGRANVGSGGPPEGSGSLQHDVSSITSRTTTDAAVAICLAMYPPQSQDAGHLDANRIPHLQLQCLSPC